MPFAVGQGFLRIQPGALAHDHEHHHKQNYQHQHIPIVDYYLPNNSADVLVGIAEKLEQLRGHTLADEPEVDDIDHVEDDDERIGEDVIEANDILQNLVVDELERQAVVHNDRHVGVSNDHQVETHANQKEFKGFLQIQMVEELCVEQINQPSADRKQHQHHQEPKYQLSYWQAYDIDFFLFMVVIAH